MRVLTGTMLALMLTGAPAAQTDDASVPVITQVKACRERVPIYEKFEVRVRFTGLVTDYFDPARLDLSAAVRTPSGKEFSVPGFLADFEPGALGRLEPVWLIRLSPLELGEYRYTVTLSTPAGRSNALPGTFVSIPSPGVPGFVRVSRRDPRCFEFDDGSFYYPVGLNVCWSSDYESYFRKMHDANLNWVRVWICPWNCWLERKDSPGRYDLNAARRIEDILDLARKHGLYVQLCLVWHGLLDERWQDNPYNRLNGGPAPQPGDFFAGEPSRELFRRKLRYLVARFGHDRHLMAWELVNEADLARNHRWEDVLDWHRHMTEFLRHTDVHARLVTASGCQREMDRQLRALPGIDFAAPHLYSSEIVKSIDQLTTEARDLGKPMLIAEFAAQSAADRQLLTDPKGRLLHAGLWAGVHSPSAGAPAPWWWDIHVEARNLFGQFAALSRYTLGEDRRGRALVAVTSKAVGPDNEDLQVRGLVDTSGGLLWVCDPRALAEGAPALPHVRSGARLRVSGLFPGEYDLEVWDTRRGTVVKRSRLQCETDSVTIDLPAFVGDLAVKLRDVAGPDR